MPLNESQRYFADLNLLAIRVAGGRFPTSGEYLTAAARLYGLCVKLYGALRDVRVPITPNSDAERIERYLEIIRASGLPLEIIEELGIAIAHKDEASNHLVLNQILRSCLSYVEEFELQTIGLRVQHEWPVLSWAEILRRSADQPNMVIQTTTEIRLCQTFEAAKRFLENQAAESDPPHPEIIISHDDLISYQSREAYVRFLEWIHVDPYKVPILTLVLESVGTDQRIEKALYQLYPHNGYTICATIHPRSTSATITFEREGLDTIISNLRAKGFVDASCDEPTTLAQALQVSTEIRLHRDLRRCAIELLIPTAS